MPSATTDFRSICGCFEVVFMNFMLKRALYNKAMRVNVLRLKTRLDGVVLSLLLSYMFWGSQLLLRCGDVESNPGPPPDTRQSRLSAAGGSGLKLAVGDKQPNPDGAKKQPTNADIMSSLQDLTSRMERNFNHVDSKFDEMREEVHQLRQEYSALKDEVKDLRDEVSELRDRNNFLEQENSDLNNRCDLISRKTDDLEDRSKRNNLIFYGLDRQDKETNEECENMLKDLFKEELSCDCKVRELQTKGNGAEG
jgi:cell division protein FtsB